MNKTELLVIGPYPPQDMDALAADFVVHRLWEAPDRNAFLGTIGDRVRAIGTRGELGADAALMDSLPNLEIIACYGVGVDAIDLVHARSRGIKVTNTPDVLTEDVADMGLALLLAAARRIPAGDAHVRSGAWLSGPIGLTTRFAGKRLGIVGLGRIGRAVARRAAGFDVSIAYTDVVQHGDVGYDFHADVVSLAGAVDFLIVCAAGGSGTRALINDSVLQALGPSGILVNISRGNIVDQSALLAALREGRIAGAGLDVFATEPTDPSAWSGLDNVVLQPHHASGTRETRAAMGKLVRENLVAHFLGRKLLTEVV
jgi:lactate dehydrogenase-like 2-hydroxyacid dehydrogenase